MAYAWVLSKSYVTSPIVGATKIGQLEEAIGALDVKLDAASVQKHNAAVLGYIHDDETRKGILANNGLPDDANAPKDAVHLNDLDSWQEFHDAELK